MVNDVIVVEHGSPQKVVLFSYNTYHFTCYINTHLHTSYATLPLTGRPHIHCAVTLSP